MPTIHEVIAGSGARVGTVQFQAPLGGGGWAFEANAANYQNTDHAIVPDTGLMDSMLTGRFDDTTYYTA